MMRRYCDLCCRPVKARDTVLLSGSLANISGAETVCRDCAAAANRVAWRDVCRREIARVRKTETPCTLCKHYPPEPGKVCEACPAEREE